MVCLVDLFSLISPLSSCTLEECIPSTRVPLQLWFECISFKIVVGMSQTMMMGGSAVSTHH